MRVQTPQGFHQKCTKCGSLKNFHTWKISMKVQTPQVFHRECTECGLLRNSTLSKYRYKIQLPKSFIEITECGPLENSTLRKYRWKTKLLKGFFKNVLSIDLLKIPYLENIDEKSNFSRVSSKFTKCGPLKHFILRESRCWIKLLKSFIEIYQVWTSEKINI